MFLPMLIIASLATYKLAYLLVWEEGPFDIFVKFRALLGIRLIRNEELGTSVTQIDKPTVVAKLFTCPYCLGGWIALVATFAIFDYRDVSFFVLFWFAVWGLSYLLLRLDEYLETITST